MRHTRILLLATSVVALAACEEAQTGVPPRPALAGVRYINALPDTGAIDIRPMDQVEWSAWANALAFRSATEYQPTQTGARRVRMFPTDSNPAITSAFMVDTTLTFEANVNYTVLVTGQARTRSSVRLVVIRDDVPAIPGGQIAVRALNAAGGPVNVFLTSSATDALPGTPTMANVAVNGVSSYVLRPVGSVASRVFEPGGTTALATAAGPNAPNNPTNSPAGTYLPAAGVNTAGSAFTVIYFPRSVAGSRAPQTAAFTSPAAVYYVDKVPTN